MRLVSLESRKAYASLLREFLAGCVTNDEYEDRTADIERRYGRDSAVGAVFHQVWFLYDDLSEHTLTGKHRPTREQRRFVARCVLFLRDPSGPASPWPEEVSLRDRVSAWAKLLALIGISILAGVIASLALRFWPVGMVVMFLSLGVLLRLFKGPAPGARLHTDSFVWPFAHQSELDLARAGPGLLGKA